MEKKLKHLDFLQLVITRMNVNSFFLKGWSVTLVAALFAFATKKQTANLLSSLSFQHWYFGFWMGTILVRKGNTGPYMMK